jgi:hypothetical protein
MAELKIERVGYRYPNLVLSINGQTMLIRVKPGRGKKWLKLENIESVHVYPTIENDMSRDLKVPVRDMGRLMKEVLNNFPTRMANTNEPARNLIWGWRQGMFEDKSGNEKKTTKD